MKHSISILIIVFLLASLNAFGKELEQAADTTTNPPAQISTYNPCRFKPLQLTAPVTLITVGIIGLESHWIISQNHEVKEEIKEHPHERLSFDDFAQYAPTVAVYGLNLCGVNGEHNTKECTLILGTAALLMGTSVYTIKSVSY